MPSKQETPQILKPPERKKRILTLELAKKLNQNFLGEAPDEMPIQNLKILWNKRNDNQTDKWTSVILPLSTQQKTQLNTFLLHLSRTPYNNIGAVRKLKTEKENLLPGRFKNLIDFINTAFARSPHNTTGINRKP